MAEPSWGSSRWKRNGTCWGGCSWSFCYVVFAACFLLGEGFRRAFQNLLALSRTCLLFPKKNLCLLVCLMPRRKSLRSAEKRVWRSKREKCDNGWRSGRDFWYLDILDILSPRVQNSRFCSWLTAGGFGSNLIWGAWWEGCARRSRWQLCWCLHYYGAWGTEEFGLNLSQSLGMMNFSLLFLSVATALAWNSRDRLAF